MNLFDSHSHYNDEKFDIDREQIIKETLLNGVSNFIVVGYSIESSKKAIDIVKDYDGILYETYKDVFESNGFNVKCINFIVSSIT